MAKNRLEAALRRLLGTASSATALARAAGVAPSTLSRVLEGSFVQLEGKPLVEVDPRRRRAWGETLAKLTRYASERSSDVLTIETVLGDYGLSTRDPIISAAIERQDSEQARKVELSDSVLEHILHRARDRPAEITTAARRRPVSGIVRFGVLQWPPFWVADREKSWGHQFCQRLLGALNPTEWSVEAEEYETIEDSLSAVLEGPSGCDLVFGAYSTVSRQLRGLHFIPVPGIGVPLHALHYVPQHLKGRVTVDWPSISRSEASEIKFFAHVLDGEVGELYLRGPCGFADDDIVTLTDFDTDAICEALTRGAKSDRVSLFVADRPTCLRVADRLTSRSYESVRAEKIAREYVGEDANHPGIPFDRSSTPVYRLGMAIRADAPRWFKLLEDALNEDMFRNDVAWTAHHYASIIAMHFRSFALLPLASSLNPQTAEWFSKKFEDLWTSKLGKTGFDSKIVFDQTTRRDLSDQLRDMWGITWPASTGS